MLLCLSLSLPPSSSFLLFHYSFLPSPFNLPLLSRICYCLLLPFCPNGYVVYARLNCLWIQELLSISVETLRFMLPSCFWVYTVTLLFSAFVLGVGLRTNFVANYYIFIRLNTCRGFGRCIGFLMTWAMSCSVPIAVYRGFMVITD